MKSAYLWWNYGNRNLNKILSFRVKPEAHDIWAISSSAIVRSQCLCFSFLSIKHVDQYFLSPTDLSWYDFSGGGSESLAHNLPAPWHRQQAPLKTQNGKQQYYVVNSSSVQSVVGICKQNFLSRGQQCSWWSCLVNTLFVDYQLKFVQGVKIALVGDLLYSTEFRDCLQRRERYS